MTRPKQVAKTLREILETEAMQTIIDRTANIDPTIDEVSSWWGYDLYSRRPGPAYRDGVFVGTDLDLACFMYALAERGAVINLPYYTGLRQKSTKENQRITSARNRHGNIIGLTSNKDVFSFSVRIFDSNVINTDSVGDYRNFSLTNLEGEWYSGWSTIQFMPTAKENNFLHENDLWSGSRVIFKNFVHPNRWTSYFGQYYFITKALINRLDEEAKYLNTQIKRMLDEGLQFPIHAKPTEWPKTEKEAGKSIKVKAFQTEIDYPDDESEYPTYESTVENLVELSQKRKKLVYNTIPKLRFATRATELAYFKHGQNRMPSWLKDVKWEQGYKLPRKRITWDRLVLFQPKVGSQAVAIRKREYEKSETVSLDYVHTGTK